MSISCILSPRCRPCARDSIEVDSPQRFSPQKASPSGMAEVMAQLEQLQTHFHSQLERLLEQQDKVGNRVVDRVCHAVGEMHQALDALPEKCGARRVNLHASRSGLSLATSVTTATVQSAGSSLPGITRGSSAASLSLSSGDLAIDGDNKATPRSNRAELAKVWMRRNGKLPSANDLAVLEGWRHIALDETSTVVSDTLDTIDESLRDLEAPESSAWVRLVNSSTFDQCSVLLITANSVLLGYQVQHMAVNDLHKPPGGVGSLQVTFTFLFLVEILMRMAAQRVRFFTSEDKKWNIFDLVIVAMSLIEFFIERFSLVWSGRDGASQNITSVRVLRILRIVRVVRIVRLFRFFHELRMMVNSITECTRSLVWAIGLLFVLLYVVATYLTQTVTDYRVNTTSADYDEELAGNLQELFGSLFHAVYTLFQSISGGTDWGDVAGPLAELHWAYALFMSLFLCFTLYAVLNIVTGVFVEGAIERAQSDKEAMIQNELQKEMSNVQQLEEVFKELDLRSAGWISQGEFEKVMEDPRVIAYFRTMGLHISTGYHLFRLLDLDNSNTVSVSEFVMGCLRLQGTAKNVDVATLMYENKRMMLKWTTFMDFVEDKFKELHMAIEGLRPPDGPPPDANADTGAEPKASRWSQVKEGGGSSLNLYEQTDPVQLLGKSGSPTNSKSVARGLMSPRSAK